MRHASIFAICLSLSCFLSHLTLADDSVDNAMTQDGFGDVARLYKSMTPEQQQAVLKEAGVKMEELQEMSPEQQQQVFDQLKAVHKTLSVNKVNPEAIDTSKTQSLDNTLQSLDSYQEKYSQGKIHNDVVNPPPGQ